MNGDIVIRASDTNILIILLHHLHRMTSTIIWIDVGTTSKGNRRYVNVTSIGTQIGADYCRALPGFHAFHAVIILQPLSEKVRSDLLHSWITAMYRHLPVSLLKKP